MLEFKSRGAKKYACKKKYVRRRQKFANIKSYNPTAKLLRHQMKQDMNFLIKHKNYDTYAPSFRTRAVETNYWDCYMPAFKLFKVRNNSFHTF